MNEAIYDLNQVILGTIDFLRSENSKKDTKFATEKLMSALEILEEIVEHNQDMLKNLHPRQLCSIILTWSQTTNLKNLPVYHPPMDLLKLLIFTLHNNLVLSPMKTESGLVFSSFDELHNVVLALKAFVGL